MARAPVVDVVARDHGAWDPCRRAEHHLGCKGGPSRGRHRRRRQSAWDVRPHPRHARLVRVAGLRDVRDLVWPWRDPADAGRAREPDLPLWLLNHGDIAAGIARRDLRDGAEHRDARRRQRCRRQRVGHGPAGLPGGVGGVGHPHDELRHREPGDGADRGPRPLGARVRPATRGGRQPRAATQRSAAGARAACRARPRIQRRRAERHHQLGVRWAERVDDVANDRRSGGRLRRSRPGPAARRICALCSDRRLVRHRRRVR